MESRNNSEDNSGGKGITLAEGRKVMFALTQINLVVLMCAGATSPWIAHALARPKRKDADTGSNAVFPQGLAFGLSSELAF